MKKIFTTIFTLLAVIMILSGCQKSTEEGFNSANGDVAEKYLKRLEISSSVSSENVTIYVNYDNQNRVSSVTDGTVSHFFTYNSNNSLVSVTDEGETLNVSDLYQSPYDAFETGNVLDYDNKGNPVRIEWFEDGYYADPLVGEITYDPNPNPFFYTLKAAKIIDVMDRVSLNFGGQGQSIIKARQLLPYNNINGIIFKDLSGNTKYEVHISYTYDADKYPVSAVANAQSTDDSRVYEAHYFYR